MSKNKSIVIIEDNQDLAGAVQEVLIEKGYSVSVANDGEVGLELVKSEKPSLLLLDTLLPGMNGIDVLDGLVEYRKENKLAIVMFSNVDAPDELKEARAHHIDEYLIKTQWRMEDVLSTIEKYI